MDNFLSNRGIEGRCAKSGSRHADFQQWGADQAESSDVQEKQATVPSSGNLTDLELPESSIHGDKHPKVQLIKEDEKITRILITCSCGECVELECNY